MQENTGWESQFRIIVVGQDECQCHDIMMMFDDAN